MVSETGKLGSVLRTMGWWKAAATRLMESREHGLQGGLKVEAQFAW